VPWGAGLGRRRRRARVNRSPSQKSTGLALDEEGQVGIIAQRQEGSLRQDTLPVQRIVDVSCADPTTTTTTAEHSVGP